MKFDIMCINKIFDAEIEKLKNEENDAENVIKDMKKPNISKLELENMEKNKTNKTKTIINDAIKKFDAERMEGIKNLEEIRIEIAYKKKELDTEMKMLENEVNKVKNTIEKTEILNLELRFMKRLILITYNIKY